METTKLQHEMVNMIRYGYCGNHSRQATLPVRLQAQLGKYDEKVIEAGYLKWMREDLVNHYHGSVIAGKKKQAEKVIYNVQTLLTDLKSCTRKRDLLWGKRLHVNALESGHAWNMYIVTALIIMYGKCGSMVDARRVFDGTPKRNVVCWNVVLLAYAENGDGLATLELFVKMKASGFVPDSVTYVAALKACTTLAEQGDSQSKWLKRGQEIHSEISWDLNIIVQNTLIGMYGKCGSMANARVVFDNIQKADVVSWTILISGYAENGEAFTALEVFSRMKACGCMPDSVTYVAVLKACTSMAANGDSSQKKNWLERGKEIHFEIGRDLDIFVQNTLIDMYANCGSMVDACYVFNSIPKPNVVSWNALLMGYAENGEGRASLELFSKMKAFRCAPTSVTYIAALRACTSLALTRDGGGQAECLKRGREIHSEMGSSTLSIVVQSSLLDMYRKCGSMVDARRVFDCIKKPDVVAWTALLMGYAENGDGLATLELFSKMKACGCVPDSVTYVAALKACTSLAGKLDGAGHGKWLKLGREIHLEIGCKLDVFVQNSLIDMYCKCGSMVDARRVFESIRKPDVVSWTGLLLGYVENRDELAALELFSKMKACRCAPDSVTYIAILKACILTGSLSLGRKFHAEISEYTSHIVTCLVDFYAKCGSILEAREVFDAHTRARDVSTWTALLTGYGSFGDTTSVFNLFEAMQEQGIHPDDITFVCILSCCSHAGLIKKAKEYFEAMPVRYGIFPTVMHYNCMVDILGRVNQLKEAIAIVQKMPCKPDSVTWMTLLAACRKWKNVEVGKTAFQSLVKMDKKKTAGYVLMAHIYGSMGMWEEQERVLEARLKLGPWKLLKQAYVYDKVGNMVEFVDAKEDSPEVRNKLEQFPGMKECYFACSNSKKETLCGHSERRAVVYGILETAIGEPVRAFKDMWMCDECHESIKTISKVSRRVIMVRAASKFHVMVNGCCSCGDFSV